MSIDQNTKALAFDPGASSGIGEATAHALRARGVIRCLPQHEDLTGWRSWPRKPAAYP